MRRRRKNFCESRQGELAPRRQAVPGLFRGDSSVSAATGELIELYRLASEGFYLFPIKAGTKGETIDGVSNQLVASHKTESSRNHDQIEIWYNRYKGCNWAISTHRFKKDEALVVVDVDVKKGKDGFQTATALELQGFEFSPTLTQSTPTGGAHFIYRWRAPLRPGTDTLGRGLDVRSRGGYIVCAPSTISGKAYSFRGGSLCETPTWIVRRLEEPPVKKQAAVNLVPDINYDLAFKRAIEYLSRAAPSAIEGAGGDQTTFAVAARIKDMGLHEADCAKLMGELWNPRCEPPWSIGELFQKVNNAYHYGQNIPGASAPERFFGPVGEEKQTPPNDEGPPGDMAKLNEKYAFVLVEGSHQILYETENSKGKFHLQHLSEQTFHAQLASHLVARGDKAVPITKEWMKSPERRSYRGFVFDPSGKCSKDWYNLWRGFAFEPSPPGTGADHPAVRQFLEHAKENVCDNDETLFQWLIGFFAHIVQRPAEKPQVALVLRGRKGVGKNALIARVSALLGSHSCLTAKREKLTGRFNGHLENCLLFTLDEAFWSGDKEAEGILKDLVTGEVHDIEHKGKEGFSVDNFTRVVIIGNEEWIVPASDDERRYAVFDVGEGKKQNLSFFRSMRLGMEQGGYSHLLRFLLDFSLDGIELNQAPNTKGLLDQKMASLPAFESWWLECLHEGVIAGCSSDRWPEVMSRLAFRNAFEDSSKNKRWLPGSHVVGKLLRRFAPSVKSTQLLEEGAKVRKYLFPDLKTARSEWDKAIGHKTDWPKDS